jgi:acyl dehydratase
VFIGETMHVELNVREKKDALRMGGGLITMDVKIINQDGKSVQSGSWTVLAKSHAAEAKEAAQKEA